MLNLKIFSPNGLIKETEASHVQVTIDNVGSFGVLSGHAPVISAIMKGYLKVDSSEVFYVSLIGAIFKMENNEIVVTCEELAIGSSIEESNELLDKTIQDRKNQNRERNIELALAENELRKQIKKTGAGHM